MNLKLHRLRPRLLDTLKDYNKRTFMADLMSGTIVGIVALPLAIAFAIASGVGPEKGIITAVVAGFLISILGGSRVQIGGPTGAFIVIVSGIVAQYGVDGLIVATILAGLMLIALGLFRLGAIIKFIPYPIVIGFTTGIGVTIFTTQIADLLGLSFGASKVPGDFIGKWWLYLQHLDSISWPSVMVSLVSIALILLTPRVSKRVPGSLVAIVVITIAVYLLKTYTGFDGIETIGDRFSLDNTLPDPAVPAFSWEGIRLLFPVAFTIALLGAIESLLSATVADGVTGEHHDSNTELIAQGIANVVTPLFGGIPATGAIARTMTNINNGGRTPIAGVVHTIVLLLIFLFLMPLAQYIPMACLAGVLAVVAYNMCGWSTFRGLLSGSRGDVAVLLTTFVLTVIFDLTIAIEIGLVLACLLFMNRVMKHTHIDVITDQIRADRDTDLSTHNETITIPTGVEIYEIKGPFFFGVATRIEELMAELGHRPKVRIIRMRRVPFIDSTGEHNLALLCAMAAKEGTATVLSGVNAQVRQTITQSGLVAQLGESNVCFDIHDALAQAERIVRGEVTMPQAFKASSH
ncbi:MAG: SulP family inorganic anion transporter [Bacteroidales bacterium]|nr:SulP family inorganic anion transporter [Bacteroidales bacterium]